MRYRLLSVLLSSLVIFSCGNPRIKEHKEWGSFFESYGIKNAGFILRDHGHDAVHYYNLAHDTAHYLPASTFKILNSLIGLELGIAQDDNFVIPWDSVVRRPEWNKDMNMREAFKVSCVPYYQELARKIGRERMQHYLDTVRYGNKTIGNAIDSFWLDNSLRISPDEQLGLMKKLYFNELPFSDRTQRIVRSMMLQEDTNGRKLYYKTGWGQVGNKDILWVVGFVEYVEHVKEHEKSMNKSDVRNYVQFFAENFEIPAGDTSRDWVKVRLELLHQLLDDYQKNRGK